MDVLYLAKYAEALGCTIADLTDGVTDIEAFTLEPDFASMYPYNLILAVSGVKDRDEEGNVTDEAKLEMYSVYIPALLKSVKSLSEREQKILSLRFEHGLTYEQCGYRFNVTRERIRQVEAKALRRLRHPMHYKRWHYDTIGKYYEAKDEASRYLLENITLKDKFNSLTKIMGLSNIEPPTIEEKKKILDIDIEEMELSVRSYNCLKRAGINKISDMNGFTVNQFMKVRNLGRKSIVEIADKLKEYGIEVADE